MRGRQNRMISLDTNVVLRFLLNDIPEETKKADVLIKQNKVYVTDVTLMEIIYVLERALSLPRKEIKELIISFLSFANVVHNTVFLIDAVTFYSQHPSLSIVDCYASAEASAYHNRLVTFDKRLVSQGGDHVDSL